MEPHWNGSLKEAVYKRAIQTAQRYILFAAKWFWNKKKFRFCHLLHSVCVCSISFFLHTDQCLPYIDHCGHSEMHFPPCWHHTVPQLDKSVYLYGATTPYPSSAHRPNTIRFFPIWQNKFSHSAVPDSALVIIKAPVFNGPQTKFNQSVPLADQNPTAGNLLLVSLFLPKTNVLSYQLHFVRGQD